MTKAITFLALLLSCSANLIDAVKLEGYNVDPSGVTVSGLSAGGAMATQFHFAFSQEVSGVGVYAGLPYTCGKGGIADASQCMSIPDWFAPLDGLISHTESLGSAGSIDPLSNVRGSKAYIFHGTKDTTVHPGNGDKVEGMYQHFGAEVKTEFGFAANHGFPTDFYGAACASSSAATQYINNCDYDGAFEMFNFLYGGGLQKPDNSGGNPPGELLEFDQTEFLTGSSMDTIGFVYIPTGCKDKSRVCKLHIAFHGCVQSRTNAGVGDAYATKTGYIHSAEANNIIVIFPQIVAMGMTNPNSCFDWWGYLNANFLTKAGAQMRAIQSMMHRVMDCPNCQSESPASSTTPEPPTGACGPNEVVFNPVADGCEYYTICACGGEDVLLKCAPGLYFDAEIDSCNFIQLVDCENGFRNMTKNY